MVSGNDPMRGGRVLALGPVRHACHACGSCCHGWQIFLGKDEHERIARHAEALGVADPIVGGMLRQVDDRCVFLGEDRLCRIHARFGAAEKPLVCQIYPRRRVSTEDALRVGADPSCSSTWRSFRDGPLLDFAVPVASYDEERPPDHAAREDELLTLLGTPGMTVARLVAHLSDESHDPTGLPSSFTAGVLARMKKLDTLLAHPAVGAVAITDLAPTRAFLRAVDPRCPPPLTLPDDASAFTLEVARRTLFLRLGEYDLTPDELLVLVLAGAVACAYADPRIERFGPALSAWSRVARIPGAWRLILHDRGASRALASRRVAP